MDDNPDGGGDAGDGTDAGGDDMGGDDTSGDETDGGSDDSGDNQNGQDSELKAAEDELYSDLSDQQKLLRDKTLKINYIELHKTITIILERLNTVVKDTYNLQILDFVIDTMERLKEYVKDYLTETFDTKTYQENFLFYQQVLITIKKISDMIPQIDFKVDNKE